MKAPGSGDSGLSPGLMFGLVDPGAGVWWCLPGERPASAKLPRVIQPSQSRWRTATGTTRPTLCLLFIHPRAPNLISLRVLPEIHAGMKFNVNVCFETTSRLTKTFKARGLARAGSRRMSALSVSPRPVPKLGPLEIADKISSLASVFCDGAKGCGLYNRLARGVLSSDPS